MSRMGASAVALLLWSLASLQHHHGQLLIAAAERIQHLAGLGEELRGRDIALVATACAELQYTDNALFRALAQVRWGLRAAESVL